MPGSPSPSARSAVVLAALGLLGIAVGATWTKSQEPKPELQVVESGASRVSVEYPDHKQALSWAAVVGNPRDDVAVGVRLEVEALDEAGDVIDTDHVDVTAVFPGETTGVAGLVEKKHAADVHVSVDRVYGWLRESDVERPRAASDVTLAFTHTNTPLIGFKVGSGDVKSVNGDVVFRDAHGRIVGGTDIVHFGLPGQEADTGEVIGSFWMPDLDRVEVYLTPRDVPPAQGG